MSDDEDRCDWCGLPWSLHPIDEETQERKCTQYPEFVDEGPDDPPG